MISTDKLMPLGQKIVVEPLGTVERSKGGLIIPDTARTKSMEGMVIGIGTGEEETNYTGTWPPVEMGDRVLFGRYAGTELKIEDTGREIVVLGVTELLGIVNSKRGSKGKEGRKSGG